MESIPDSGVEIKNEDVAAVEAPDFRNVTAVGITEQEQSGSGTPKSEALKTSPKVFFPNQERIFSTVST